METMEELLRGIFYIATADGNQPRVRAFDSCVRYGDRFYFQTANNKKVYQQLKDNPKVEIVAHGETGTVRVTAEAFEETDPVTIEGVEKAVGKYRENPNLVVFYLQNAKAVLMTPDGGTEELSF
jgi:uncharacterized pyridoxamine 5'-phosphate oxidase family protein